MRFQTSRTIFHNLVGSVGPEFRYPASAPRISLGPLIFYTFDIRSDPR